MYILGMNMGHHGSICLLKDGEVLFFLEEERVSRKKYSKITNDYCNAISKISQYTNTIDYICIGWSSPKEYCGTYNYNELCNLDISDFNLIKDSVYQSLLFNLCGHYIQPYNEVFNKLNKFCHSNTQFVIIDKPHHYLHASYAFYTSGFTEAAIVVIDGQGGVCPDNDKLFEKESIWKFDYNTSDQLYCNYDLDIDSGISCSGIGTTYTHETIRLGFKPNEEGKTMGLASYKPSDVDNPEWSNKIQLANNVQLWSQEKALYLIKHAIEISGSKNICISGGYGFNCVANYYFRKNLPADINLYCTPIAGDAGNAIGACKEFYHRITNDKTVRPELSLYYGSIPQY